MRAIQRALQTTQAYRVGGDLPLIEDSTEYITPEAAYTMLLRNTRNRPVQWHKVDEYAAAMQRGEWPLHSQGIILDKDGNILSGQKRLWAIIHAGVGVYMRVSRGNDPSVSDKLDRGTPQSARDLAARRTGRIYSPLELRVVRAIHALETTNSPSTDDLSVLLAAHDEPLSRILGHFRRVKKSPSLILVIAVLVKEQADIHSIAFVLNSLDAIPVFSARFPSGGLLSKAMAQAVAYVHSIT